MSFPLTERQELFCHEYIVDLNGTRAAIAAGASEKSAHVQANRWLKLDKVKARIAELQAKALATPEGQAKAAEKERRIVALEDRAAEVIEELRNHAFANLFKIIEVTPWGGIRCRDVTALPEEVQRQIKKVKVSTRTTEKDGETRTDVEYEVELWDKLGALKMLASHYALLDGAGAGKDGDGEDDGPVEWEITMHVPNAAG